MVVILRISRFTQFKYPITARMLAAWLPIKNDQQGSQSAVALRTQVKLITFNSVNRALINIFRVNYTL